MTYTRVHRHFRPRIHRSCPDRFTWWQLPVQGRAHQITLAHQARRIQPVILLRFEKM
jgi:hypothetical protein